MGTVFGNMSPLAAMKDQLGPIFTLTLSAYSYSAAQDLFELKAPSTRRLRLRGVKIGQYSDFADAQAELLPVLIKRWAASDGSDGTGGSAMTAVKVDPEQDAALFTANKNNTTAATGGTPETAYADAWNVAAGLWYYPPAAERLWVPASGRLVVNLAAPADALTINATLIVEQVTLTD